MREQVMFSNDWFFNVAYEEGMEKSQSLEGFENVNLPHSNVELPYNYFHEEDFQIVTIYKKSLSLSEDLKDRLLFIQFEGVMAYAKVYLNGELLEEHKGGYTAFDVRIDNAYDWTRDDNMLSVVVDSSERDDIPPFGGLIDYLTYGGIYRDVSLGIYDKVFIPKMKIETRDELEDKKGLKAMVWLDDPFELAGDVSIDLRLESKDGDLIKEKSFDRSFVSRDEPIELELLDLEGLKLWDMDSPNLYELSARIKGEGFEDELVETFGFRTAEFTEKGFFLNGRNVKIRGLNRHQAFPYVGYAMPKRVQEKDADILKDDLSLNLVRTSHYPQSKHFINRCDEIGLLVFEEIPGWQYLGNDEWKKIVMQDVEDMIVRDWNHPSIILWGVRINESDDDDELYKATNELARELDPSRQTGGVRCITDSTFLEDVYTMNDFVHNGIDGPLRDQKEITGLDRNVPYMVTEYNGHMYPTKRFDQEERQMEHSLRHLRVQNASYLDDSISGAIGWCAFDYNTHKDFGSGDRICYHGVMDMFRIPKFASYVYKSQVEPEKKAVMEPITFWTRGERSIGGVVPLIVFTNCDYIEFQYADSEAIRVYPDKENYAGMPYPPVVIDGNYLTDEILGEWGHRWQDFSIKGYYKDELVAERKYAKNPVPESLSVEVDDYELISTQKDATRVIVKVLDQCGNILPFLDAIIKVELEGPARVQGPKELVLKGGAVGFWIESLNEKGTIDLKVSAEGLGSKEFKIEVI